MVQDKKISEAAEILLKGARMLSFHCPECLLPLFQSGDRVFCPSCKREYEIVQNENKVEIKEVNPVEGTVNDSKEKESVKIIDNNKIEEKLELLIDKLIDKALNSDNSYELKELVGLIKDLSFIYLNFKKGS